MQPSCRVDYVVIVLHAAADPLRKRVQPRLMPALVNRLRLARNVPGYELAVIAQRESSAFFQSSSTRARTSSLIRITSGHGRMNPSSFHLRVASMPILEP